MNNYEQATQEVRDAFQALCKGRVEAAVKAEREACAKVCDELDAMNWSEAGEYSSGYGDEIRKRGTQ